jgi:hypothetical protein
MCFGESGNYAYTCLFVHGIETTAVPLPASGWLLLSAFAGLVTLRQRGPRV